MRESFQQQIHESRNKADKKAGEVAKYKNKTEGRGAVKGLFNKEKKLMSGMDISHEEAVAEDKARKKLVGREKTGPVLIEVDEKTGTYRKDKSDEEKMRAVREDINKILPDNFVKELTRLKEMRMSNPESYSGLLTPIIMQAQGEKEYVWGQKFEPKREFSGWTAEDCQELLKDLGEDIWLGGIKIRVSKRIQ